MTEQLVSYLERRAGSYLRTVAVYDEESWEIVYLRDDLDRRSARQQTEKIYGGVKTGLGPSGLSDEIGERYATLQVRDDAVLLNMPWNGSEGAFVDLEPGAASQLTGFIDECLKHGYRGTVSLPRSPNTD
ncbi:MULTISPECIES: hypothetical protein [Halolamina]|uniref:Uncharacterized protein n=1 Tax=Halolamina pelagica TaxID=699431 RepID=A0A1I5Q8F0_9EURY|nr:MULTISPECIES: hypothetical protein [Halolamina]NHX35149.1 hypothetical protein [Halolamina sp. R1-12]SFP42608.1 hypothetical protein SAMN05216277_103308 [Halolamina pelagica]